MAIAIRFAATPLRLIPPASGAGGGGGGAGHGGAAACVGDLGRACRGGRLEVAVANSARCVAKKGGGAMDAVVGTSAATLGGTGVEGGDQLSVVMKFGGSSVSSAARMQEVAGLILAFPEERPVVVLSAMGKTTNLLLLAGEKAVGCGVIRVSEIEEWNMIKDLHINYAG